jgi:hypothetical protein
MTKAPSPLTKYLNAINQTKENLVTEETTDFNVFVISHCMMHNDTVLLANEMNKLPGLTPVQVNSFYLHAVPKRKRYSPWYKADKIDDLELIKTAYKYNNAKAKQALQLLSKEQLELLRNKYTDKNHDLPTKNR